MSTMESRTELDRGTVKADDRTKECAVCRKRFRPVKPHARLCSPACVGAAQRRPRTEAECQQCGSRFEFVRKKGRPDRKYCSQECSKRGRRQHGREVRMVWRHGRNRTVEVRHCEHCGAEFEAIPTVKQDYCSVRCSKQGTGEIVPLNPDDYQGLLNWAVRRHTTERPIEDTEEYQSAWAGLLAACKDYRGKTNAKNHVVNAMVSQIKQDKYGNQRADQRVANVPSSTSRLEGDDWHPLDHNLSPVAVAIVAELQSAIEVRLASTSSEAAQVLRWKLQGLMSSEIAERSGMAATKATALFRAVREDLEESLRWSWDGLDHVGAVRRAA